MRLLSRRLRDWLDTSPQNHLKHPHLSTSLFLIMAQDPPAPPRSGLSLYANLLESKSTPGTISSAPVTYKQPEPEQDEAAKKQQALAGILQS